MSIAETGKELKEEFELLGEDWQDRYEYIIQLGHELPPMPQSEHTEANKVKGCQSNVWLAADWNGKTIHLRGDSDALIVKGLVALVLRIYQDRTPEDILTAELDFLEDIGLAKHLSPTRGNGLAAMIKQIKIYALAYKEGSAGTN